MSVWVADKEVTNQFADLHLIDGDLNRHLPSPPENSAGLLLAFQPKGIVSFLDAIVDFALPDCSYGVVLALDLSVECIESQGGVN